MLDLKRREFMTLLGGAAAAWPLAARAQQQPLPVIGYFSGRSPEAEVPIRMPFLKALETTGFEAGRNVAIEYRFAEGQQKRLPVIAAEFVRQQVTMLVVTDQGSALAAKAATATNPIVFASGLDPVQLGLVSSFNRPGGNATGLSVFTSELAWDLCVSFCCSPAPSRFCRPEERHDAVPDYGNASGSTGRGPIVAHFQRQQRRAGR